MASADNQLRKVSATIPISSGRNEKSEHDASAHLIFLFLIYCILDNLPGIFEASGIIMASARTE
eukprot:6172512-Pleurochrysis_carterae.AAC.8